MSPKEITSLDITNEVFKGPVEIINKISEKVDLKYTKVIETFVLEERNLKLSLLREGSTFLKGDIIWIGNKKDNSQGSIICMDSGNELKLINPNDENTGRVLFDLKKEAINIITESKLKCSVCGKNIEIFDEFASCPICKSKAHREHLIEWIKMKHTCPSCEKALKVTDSGEITIG